MKRLVIDYNKWGQSALLNLEGKMCCLGFACKKLGASENQMFGRALPRHIGMMRKVRRAFGLTNVRQEDAARFNDNFHDGFDAKKSLATLRKTFRDAGTILVIRNLPEEFK